MSKYQTVWQEDFVKNASYRIEESLRMIRKSLDSLQENDIWLRPNEVSNSVGNQILHLCGNMTQYGIGSLGGHPDTRERDAEFSASETHTKSQLLEKLEKVVLQVKEEMEACSIEELLRIRSIQGFKMSGLGVIIHIVEHLSYHTGQIAFWTKILKNKDLGFYDGIDLNTKNSE
ncbi:MAG: DinB family protein [Flavobacteriaceae bacterium]